MTRRLHRIDEGSTMISVVIVGLIMSLLAVVVSARVISDLNQALQHRRWDQAVNVAEAGVDHALFEIGRQIGTPVSNVNEVPPATGEKAWVLAKAAAQPGLPHQWGGRTREGEWRVVIPPSTTRVVYGVGYVPSRAAAHKTRIVRVQYGFGAATAETAIVTNKDLIVGGTATLRGADGGAHSNQNITIEGGFSANYLSATGTITPSAITSYEGAPRKEILPVDPRAYYGYSDYDLCLIGGTPRVLLGPAKLPGHSGTPCTGTVLDPQPSGVRYVTATGKGKDKVVFLDAEPDTTCPLGQVDNGWELTAALPGVYYAFGSSVALRGGGTSTTWEGALVAEMVGGVGGDVVIEASTSTRHPAHLSTAGVSGRDLIISGSATIEGLFASHEQLRVTGTGDFKIIGALVAEDTSYATDTSPVRTNCIKGNATIEFDGNQDFDADQFVRTLHWSEL